MHYESQVKNIIMNSGFRIGGEAIVSLGLERVVWSEVSIGDIPSNIFNWNSSECRIEGCFENQSLLDGKSLLVFCPTVETVLLCKESQLTTVPTVAVAF